MLAWKILSGGALLLAASAVLLVAVLFTQIENEGKQRRDQSCLTFEGAHLDEIKQLKATYKFLLDPKADRGLKRAVLPSLHELEAKAKSDSDLLGARVPAYCDEPGLGLPEPDPVVPRRPGSFSTH